MNKLLIVTGGTKGIGKSIIERFASSGFDVMTCARNEEELRELKERVELSNKGVSINVFRADLSDKQQTLAFIDFIHSSGRQTDVLVNNAGVFFPGQINNEEEGVFEKSMETNVNSAYHITRGVLKGMMDRGSGHIFNICSVASIEPYVRGASYCISKFALLGMSKVLREEMKEYGIKVTAVIPGSTFTTSWENAEIPEEEFMKAEDIAKSIFDVYSLSSQTVVEEIIMRPQKGDL